MIDELLKQIYKMMQETQTGLHECYDNADLSYNKGRFEVLCEIQDLIKDVEEHNKDDIFKCSDKSDLRNMIDQLITNNYNFKVDNYTITILGGLR